MSEVLLPTWIVPEVETQEWLDEGSAVFGAAFAPGIAQRQSYGGLRLKLSRRHTVRGEEKAQLLSVLNQTRGRYNVMRTKVHFAHRGSFPATEGITNNTFLNGTTGWTASSANISLSVSDRILRSTKVSIAADSVIRAPAITVPSGGTNSYVARVMALAANGAMDYRLRLGTTAGNNDIAQDGSDYTAPGFRSLVGTTSATTIHYGILDGVGGRSVDDLMDFSYTSFSRCALVNGGSQTGNELVVDGAPSSANGVLLPGDFFEINGEIKMVTSSLGTDSGGAGTLVFEPALVRSPLDNDPVIIYEPMGKFLVSNIQVDNRFGQHAVVTYDLEHIYE